jgi:hypothetical protein
MSTPTAINAMTPIAAPTPIPAFAPVDRPLLAAFAAAAAVDEGVDVAAALAVVVELDIELDVTTDVDVELSATTACPKILAILYRGFVLSLAQQSALLPQHQDNELLVPSQGLTTAAWPWTSG